MWVLIFRNAVPYVPESGRSGKVSVVLFAIVDSMNQNNIITMFSDFTRYIFKEYFYQYVFRKPFVKHYMDK